MGRRGQSGPPQASGGFKVMTEVRGGGRPGGGPAQEGQTMNAVPFLPMRPSPWAEVSWPLLADGRA